MIDSNLLKALEAGKCTVTYEKIEGPKKGEDRDMLCTLSPDIIPMHTSIKQNPESEHLLVWSLDREDWRSVRVTTIKGWKVAEDAEEVQT